MFRPWLRDVVFLYPGCCVAQDAVKVDLAITGSETENAQVRVLRVHYGPHEKSVMHSHPAAVAVFLSDGAVRPRKPM